MRRPLQIFSLGLLCLSLTAQSIDPQLYRTFDGSQNNLSNPDWGQAGTNLLRVATVDYADSIAAPNGVNRPNPRRISNSMFSQSGLLNDPMELSDFCWVWGQFLDHDIGLTTEGSEDATIQVAAGDPAFDPLGFGTAVIPMHRNKFDPTTGTDVNNPRQHPNEITAFIDASNVYGSDVERADWLRTFSEGKLKTSAGNMLPYNTLSGLYGDEIDPTAPHMDQIGISPKFYVAGDIRANENPLLASFHTLFVREHNRQCERLQKAHPDWTDEQLYQYARKIVGGLIQSIVYDEWLPAMGVELSTYTGYQADVHPQLSNVFTGAAFRLGHTLLNGTILRVDSDGNEIPQGHLALRDAFFNPFVMLETGDIDPFLQGMASQTQQEMDAKIIDDVRNFLFGPPGAGGLDLAAINIQRGRERGLPDFNTLRTDLGLAPYSYFQEISSNAAIFTKLLSLYNNTDNIDAWVGMLSERPMPGALFGETIMTLMHHQFMSLRDGDRFYYEIDPLLDAADIEYIQRTSFRDIIMYNSSINLMQDNVFLSMPHADICGAMTLNVGGWVLTESGQAVDQVSIVLSGSSSIPELVTPLEGNYYFDAMPACDITELGAYRNDNHLNGVTTFDLILFQKHILNVSMLDSPYKIIAGDVDDSGHLSTIDLIRIRRLILGIDTAFAFVPSWRFIPAAYQFSNPADPFADAWPETIDFSTTNAADYGQGFIAIKHGDANGSVTLGLPEEELVAPRAPLATLAGQDQWVEAGTIIDWPLRLMPQVAMAGYQFALQTDGVELLDVQAEAPLTTNDYHLLSSRELRLSWYTAQTVTDQPMQLTLQLRATRSGRLSEMLSWGAALQPEVYSAQNQIGTLGWDLQDAGPLATTSSVYPNPVRDHTQIEFHLTEATDLLLEVYDGTGRVIYQNNRHFPAGSAKWWLQAADLSSAGGTLYYRLRGKAFNSSGKMVMLP